MKEPPNPLKELLLETLEINGNDFHPLVIITGQPIFGEGIYIGALSEVNAKGALVKIGDNCDIASFVAINVADSHRKCIEQSDRIERKNILIGNNVFIGSHSVVKGGANIGHHSVIASGTVVDAGEIPPYSLVSGNPMSVKPSYYKHRDKS